MWDLLESLESMCPSPPNTHTQRSISILDSLVAAHRNSIPDGDNMIGCGAEKWEDARSLVPS